MSLIYLHPSRNGEEMGSDNDDNEESSEGDDMDVF